ncbi:hypothetical protein PQO03_02995 [Lentisphaera profundi]|uniref:DUF4178 domain-containing protein n=1 Tax=Lentisphaera profundi TaxID=1658616 RepID=A0ABY7VVS4_9BACT|nr:hypothetical protein [Lentisphaera profundi]WDE96926.1 hypothetical protein PQO03_02995 [Lentisphaera profundi]
MKVLKIVLIGLGIIVGLLFTVALVIVDSAPETYVYKENRIPKKYTEHILALKLIDKDETIKYFYSDGFMKIDEGMYFITNKQVVLYSEEWPEPAEKIPFDQIINVEIEYNDTWLDDSWVYLNTEEFEYEFPLSNERGGDKKFIKYLKSQLAEDIPIVTLNTSSEDPEE